MKPELPRILTPAAARRLEISSAAVRHAIARGRWRRLAHGVVLTSPTEATRADWALVGLESASVGGALSGWDALRNLGVASRRPPADHVVVLDRVGHNRRIGGVLIRPTSRPYGSSLTSVHDPELPLVRIASVARAISDTALDFSGLAPVRAMMTSAIQRGLCTPEDLVDQLGNLPRNRSALFRRAILDVRRGAHSIAEAEAVELLIAERVPDFEVNVDIIDGRGQLIAVADLFWRELRAVLEVDSEEFHFTRDDWHRTEARHNRLTRAGLAVTHHPPSVIRAGGRTWAGQVAAGLQSRAAELGVAFVRGTGRDDQVARVGSPPPWSVRSEPP